ncbi:MAG: sulfate adenylyltransferase, partial [Kiritimatiellia bacterium]
MNNEQQSVPLIPPHGGTLKPMLAPQDRRKELLQEARALPGIRMSSRETSDLIMLGTGAFSPLEGFMRRKDYLNVVNSMHMEDGTLWPIPVTLSVTREAADNFKEGSSAALVDDESGALMGTLEVEECYEYDKEKEAKEVFRTTDSEHPGVAKVFAQNDVLLAGRVTVFSELNFPERFGDYYLRPAETRAIFAERGWKTIA